MWYSRFRVVVILFFLSFNYCIGQEEDNSTITEWTSTTFNPSSRPGVKYNYLFCDDWNNGIREIIFSYKLHLNPLFDGIGISWKVEVNFNKYYDACVGETETEMLSDGQFASRSSRKHLGSFFSQQRVEEILNSVSVDVEFPIKIMMDGLFHNGTDVIGKEVPVISKNIKAWVVGQNKPWKDWMFISYSDLDEAYKEDVTKEAWMKNINLMVKYHKTQYTNESRFNDIIRIESFYHSSIKTKITLVGGCLETEFRMIDEYIKTMKELDKNYIHGKWALDVNDIQELSKLKAKINKAKALSEAAGIDEFKIMKNVIGGSRLESTEFDKKFTDYEKFNQLDIPVDNEEVQNIKALKKAVEKNNNAVNQEVIKLQQKADLNHNKNTKNIQEGIKDGKASAGSSNSFRKSNTIVNGKMLWGYKNTHGDWSINPKYYSISENYNGLCFGLGAESLVALNMKGEELFKLSYASSEGPIEDSLLVLKFKELPWPIDGVLFDYKNMVALTEISGDGSSRSGEPTQETPNFDYSKYLLLYRPVKEINPGTNQYDVYTEWYKDDVSLKYSPMRWYDIHGVVQKERLSSESKRGREKKTYNNGGTYIYQELFFDRQTRKLNVKRTVKNLGINIPGEKIFQRNYQRNPEKIKIILDMVNSKCENLGATSVSKVNFKMNPSINKKSYTEDSWGNPINTFLNGGKSTSSSIDEWGKPINSNNTKLQKKVIDEWDKPINKTKPKTEPRNEWD